MVRLVDMGSGTLGCVAMVVHLLNTYGNRRVLAEGCMTDLPHLLEFLLQDYA
jgi:hypothetical protein